MTDAPVQWPLLTLVVTAVVTSCMIVAAFFVFTNKNKADLITEMNNRFDRIREELNAHKLAVAVQFETMSDRIRVLEIFDAGLQMLVKQQEEFRTEVRSSLRELKETRERDMTDLRRRLEHVMHSNITRRNDQTIAESRE